MWTDDPIADFNRYERFNRAQEEYYDSLPRCRKCRERFAYDDLFEDEDGTFICFGCLCEEEAEEEGEE